MLDTHTVYRVGPPQLGRSVIDLQYRDTALPEPLAEPAAPLSPVSVDLSLAVWTELQHMRAQLDRIEQRVFRPSIWIRAWARCRRWFRDVVGE